ncbi:MAG TPA: hypothetical protein VHA52_10785 [Candidatus Babeliaceae bacterium]|nr:hypothetical protein [Candidatus Babeliaceae bacterium]
MDGAIMSVIVLGVVLALAVFVYGLVVPPLFGRPRYAMPILDIAILAAFLIALIFILRVTGLWGRLLTGL